MGVRAETIIFTELDKADLIGKLILCEYLGSEQFAYVDCGDALLITVRIDPATEMEIGSSSIARFEVSHTNYEDIELKSSVARTGVTGNNKIEADLDTVAFKLSYAF